MNNLVKHILLWLAYAGVLFALFAGIANVELAIMRTSLIIIFQVIVFYTNLKWLLPRFYGENKLVAFLAINLALVVAVALIGMYGMVMYRELMPHPERPNLPDGLRRHHKPTMRKMMKIEFFLTHSVPAILGAFTSLLFFNQLQRKKRDEEQALNLEAEKDFLVSQINPHFLFNALNNIYAFTLDNPVSSNAIMQLSQMLDYSLYRGQDRSVSLEQEVKYIENYIALFKLKDDEIEEIEFEYGQADLSRRLAPMLLVPFIENAFKHGNIEEIKGAHIRISLKTDGDKILFQCENTFAEGNKNKDEGGGIGIPNVKRRLELLYPNKHTLSINTRQGSPLLYQVSLTIRPNEA